ncbi:MAG TPA: wax ester/triacylglycerol synthase family O-acyltransferase [Acidimicrobiales bacterium]|nr:wax ester/triacylglycerol synthase family O-acyltransferase [Acidimicrobiales bacterium]
MKRLSGLDSMFLYAETPSMHMHVTGVVLLDPSTMPGGYSADTLKEMLRGRIHLLPPFRERVVTVPFQLANPVLIEDPDFDIDNHVFRVGVPSPGTVQELAELVGNISSRPLDRSKPLWEMWVAEGLEHGYVALIAKMHHSVIDGVTGADLMVHLFDLEPDAKVEPPEQEWEPEHKPSDLEMVGHSLVSRLRHVGQVFPTIASTGRSALELLRLVRRSEGPGATLPFTAPRTMFNRAITPHRSIAFGKASLDDFKLVKKVFGTTVNDVVLAACAGSLRNWLIAHDDLPDKPLVASVPVSVRDEGKPDLANQISAMFVGLPVQLEDPVERLLRIQGDTKAAKEVHGALGADTLQNWAQFAGPTVFSRAARFYSASKLAERHPVVHNLVISNVPGPPVPLYSAGARVAAVYPLGPILEGAGLNLTVLSNMGSVDFGAIASRELVPDLWDIATGFTESIEELRKLAEEKEAG